MTQAAKLAQAGEEIKEQQELLERRDQEIAQLKAQYEKSLEDHNSLKTLFTDTESQLTNTQSLVTTIQTQLTTTQNEKKKVEEDADKLRQRHVVQLTPQPQYSRPRPPPLKDFDGTDPKGERGAIIYVREAQQYSTICGSTTDADKVADASISLTGVARRWYWESEHSDLSTCTWDKFKFEFIKQFGGAVNSKQKSLTEAKTLLLKFQGGKKFAGSISTFNLELEPLLKRANVFDEQLMQELYLDAINADVAKAIRNMKFNDPKRFISNKDPEKFGTKEIMDFAVSQEQILLETGTIKPISKSSSSASSARASSSFTPSALLTPSQSLSYLHGEPDQQLHALIQRENEVLLAFIKTKPHWTEERKQLYVERKCFNCHQTGHQVVSCPVLAESNKIKQKQHRKKDTQVEQPSKK